MKKALGILSLSVLLFSTFAPGFTYANEVEDLAKEILTEELENTGNELDNENNGDATGSNAPELNTLSSIATLQTNEAPKTFEECAELDGDNFLIKYNCNGDVIIPATVAGIRGNNVFEGQTISGFVYPIKQSGVTFQIWGGAIFSGAKINGEITINFNDLSAPFGYGFLDNITILDGGKLTIKDQMIQGMFDNITIRNGGEVILDGSSVNDSLKNGYSEGKIKIKAIQINNSVIKFNTTKNSSITIDEGTNEINNSFNDIFINNGVILPKSLKTINSSFISGLDYGGINGDIKYSGENLYIYDSFQKQNINGNIIITGANLALQNSFPNTNIEGNFICNDCTTTLQRNNKIINRNGNFQNSKISGDFVINSNNKVYLPNGSIFLNKIGGNLILSGNGFECGYAFTNLNLSGNLEITSIGDIIAKEGCFNRNNQETNMIYGDVLFSGKNINLQDSALGNSTIKGKTLIKSENNFTGINKIFYDTNILSGLNIYSNEIYIDDGAFTHNNISGGIIIKGNKKFEIQNNKTNYVFGFSTITGDIIITGFNENILSNAFSNNNIIGNTLIYGGDILLTNNSFQSSTGSGNFDIKGNIIKGTNGTFQPNGNKTSLIGGDLSLKGNKIIIENAFYNNGTIGGNLIISGNILTGTNSSMLGLKINGDVNISGSYNYFASMFLSNSSMNNLTISGKKLTAGGGALQAIDLKGNALIKYKDINVKEGFLTSFSGGNLNIVGDNIYAEGGALGGIKNSENVLIEFKNFTGTNGGFGNTNTRGNFYMSGKNLFLAQGGLMNYNIGGGLYINTENLTTQDGGLYDLKINKDLVITGKNLNLAYFLNGKTHITGDVILNADYFTGVYSQYGTISGATIGGNLNFNVNYFNVNNFLTNTTIGGNLYIPKDVTIQGTNSFKNITVAKKGIFGGAIKPIPSFTMNDGLLIKDGNSAANGIFENYQITNNEVTVSGNLSTIGTKAYAFKPGTRILNTITLAEDFETINIGDDAFCIEGSSPVKGITKKQYTEKEYHDLLTRTCIDLSFNGNHNLLLKVDGKEVLVVDSGDNNIIIPDSLKKDGYKIEWYSDELYQTGTDINNQTYNDYEYQKTIYGKYIQTNIPSSAGGGKAINTISNTEKTEQEHNSADTIKESNTAIENTSTNTANQSSDLVKEKIQTNYPKSLTRGEVAVMTNILLDVYPQLIEGRTKLDDITNACSNYADEQNFTKDEKKAIIRLCKLSIMGIHADDNKPLDEFMVNEITKNDEFSKVINRSLESYTEKDFSVVKDALKKLEGDEENVVFGTVYEVFMSIKNIFN